MRVINIDLDTAVGFDYEAQYYFITNKSTTTTRTTVQDTLNVLNIIAPTHTVTEDDLISLATTLEALYELSYTWNDDGSYIRTIQLNDYSKYPLALDVETKKIYIMNSTTIFDLTLNEGERVRIEQLQAFYKDTLGLFVELQDLRILYRLLVHFYNPVCYNSIVVADTQDSYTMTYSDTLKLSNYRGSALLTYSCQINPTQQYNYETIASITDITDNAITLTTSVPSIVQPNSTINIVNTAVTIPPTTYTADGTYTVQSIQDSTIYTTENLPANFHVTLPTLNIGAYKTFITEIDRDKQSITLTNFATDFLIGDTIVVKNTAIPTEYETLSDDGFYTIIGIEDNVIYVNEVPQTNYTAPVGAEPTAYVYKPIPILTVTAINTNTITVAESTFPSTLTINTPIAVFTTIEGEINTVYVQYGTVTGLDEAQHVVTVDTVLEDNVPKFGLLRQPVPYQYVLTTIENSNSKYLPNGQFMLDTHEQAINYLNLEPSIPTPTNEELDEDVNNIGNFNSCNTEVRNYYIINMLSVGIDRMKCKGIYSKVYTE